MVRCFTVLRHLTVCVLAMSVLGCHYEDGKWYVGESDNVPLPDFRGEVEKVNDCLVANETYSPEELEDKFQQEYTKLTSEDSWRYWGHLACLAFNDLATRKQIGRAVIFLTDRVEPGNRAHNDLEAMTILLKGRLDRMYDIKTLKYELAAEKETNMIQKLEFEKNILAHKKIQKDLENQVRKLKEIELLLDSKNKE